MEGVLDLYQQPYDPQFPVVCMDETNKQLLKEVRQPISVKPGRHRRFDAEYERNGTQNIFLFFEPLAGNRFTSVTDSRKAIDWAKQIRDLVDIHYPDASKIRLVLDNLNTHVGGSLYKAFPPDEARRILTKIEFHYTPKHGSWLNMAEIELSILSRQCLACRIPDKTTLASAVNSWQTDRNNIPSTMDWRFSTDDARIKLKKLYPTISA